MNGTDATPADETAAQQRLRAKLREIVRDPYASYQKKRVYMGRVDAFYPGADASVAGRFVFWNPTLTGCAACVRGGKWPGVVVEIGKMAFKGLGTSGSLGASFIHEVEHLHDLATIGSTDEFAPRLRQMLRHLKDEKDFRIWNYLGRHGADHVDNHLDQYFGKERGHELTPEQRETAVAAVQKRAKQLFDQLGGDLDWKETKVSSRIAIIAATLPPEEKLRYSRRKHQDGVYWSVYVGKRRIGHIGGFERDRYVPGKPQNESFVTADHLDVVNVSFDEAYRGRGLAQQAFQYVADQYPNGLKTAKFQTSRAFQGALHKMETFHDTENHFNVRPSDRKSARQMTADEEWERIKRSQQTKRAQRPHRFKAAEWTHANGHPRCRICGDDEPEGGRCTGYKPPKRRRQAAQQANIDSEVFDNDFRHYQNTYTWLTRELLRRLITENDPNYENDAYNSYLPWILKQYGRSLKASPNAPTMMGLYHPLLYFGRVLRTDAFKKSGLSDNVYDYTAETMRRLLPTLQAMAQKHEEKRAVGGGSPPQVFYRGRGGPTGGAIYRIVSADQICYLGDRGNMMTARLCDQYRPAVDRLLASGPVYAFTQGVDVIGVYSPATDELQPWVDGAGDVIEDLWQEYQGRTDHAAQTTYQGEQEYGSKMAGRHRIVASLIAGVPTHPQSIRYYEFTFRVLAQKYPWLTKALYDDLARQNDPTEYGTYVDWIVHQYAKNIAASPHASTMLGVYRALKLFDFIREKDKNLFKTVGLKSGIIDYTADQLKRSEESLHRLYSALEAKRAMHSPLRPVSNHGDPYGDPRHIFRIDAPQHVEHMKEFWPQVVPAVPSINHYLESGPVYCFVDGKTLLGLYSAALDEWQPRSASEEDLQEMWNEYTGTPDTFVRTHHEGETGYGGNETASRRQTRAALIANSL